MGGNWDHKWDLSSNAPNYPKWRRRVQAMMEASGDWSVVTKRMKFNPHAPHRFQQEFIEKDQRAQHLLIGTLDDATVGSIRKCDCSWMIFEHLERSFAGRGPQNIAKARREFHNIKYIDNDDMQSHINTVEEMAEQLSRLHKEIDDDEKMCQILDSLPESWNNVRTICQNQSDLTWQSLQAKLLLESEMRMDLHKAKSSAAGQLLLANEANSREASEREPSETSERSSSDNAQQHVNFHPSHNAFIGSFSGNHRGHRPFIGKTPCHSPYGRPPSTMKKCFYCEMSGQTIHECKLESKHVSERRASQAANANVAFCDDDPNRAPRYDVSDHANASVHWAAIACDVRSIANSMQTAFNAAST